MNQHSKLDRRSLLGGGLAAGLVLLGCSEAGSAAKGARNASGVNATKLTMYRSPSCGCCLKWADAAKAAGFDVSVVPSPDIYALKTKLGVPDELASCHTSIVGRYVVEGHVPLDSVKALIRQRPNIKGIAVPGMPLGAPGMEHPDGDKEPFEVMAFDAAGKVSRFGA